MKSSAAQLLDSLTKSLIGLTTKELHLPAFVVRVLDDKVSFDTVCDRETAECVFRDHLDQSGVFLMGVQVLRTKADVMKHLQSLRDQSVKARRERKAGK